MIRKLLSLVLFICLLSLNHLAAQEVPELQRPLVGKVAATWCPPCGGWGWDFFENLVVDNEQQATLITAHHSGLLTNPVAEAFSENFQAPYQPYFYYNTTDQEVTSSNATLKRAAIQAQVESEAMQSPIANAGILMELEGEDLSVLTKTRFFQETTGEFYLAVYFVESEIVAFQEGQGENAVHEKILTGAISSGNFGEFLGEGTIEAGAEFSHSFEASVADLNVDHLEVITIIWRKEGDFYKVVNTNLSTDFSGSVATQDIVLPNASMVVSPNIIQSASTVQLTTEEALPQAKLNLYNLNGQLVQTIYQGTIHSGTTDFVLSKPSVTPAGFYQLVLENKGKRLTQKVLFK